MKQLISLNIGKIQPLGEEGKEVPSGIFKQSVKEAVWLGKEGLAGDETADLVNHGGPDKAICVYSLEHYAFWKEYLGKSLEPGAFGENFTVLGLTEQQVSIGDIYRIGGALVQVSQPRQPCYKLARKHGAAAMPAVVERGGLTGFYFRILEEGEIAAGASFELEARSSFPFTVAEANRLKYRDRHDYEAIRALLANPALSQSWRESLTARLSKEE